MFTSTTTAPRKRYSYARIPVIMDMPNLIETQQRSYQEFLQEDVPPEKRKPYGLQEVFQSVFPIRGRDNSFLRFVSYSIGRPKYNVQECIDRGMTYAAPLRIRLRLEVKEPAQKADGPVSELLEVREEDIYLGEIPLMTEKGTFIINGAERVVVSQLHRSPGPVFGTEIHPSTKRLITAAIIPNRGAWLEFETDTNDVVHVIVDRKRKMPVTMLLRAFGYSTDEEIMDLFVESEYVPLTGRTPKKSLVGKILAQDVIDPETGRMVSERGTIVDDALFEQIHKIVNVEIRVVDKNNISFSYINATLNKDISKDHESALLEIYEMLRPGEPPAVKKAQNLLEGLFCKKNRYDFSRVGRYRMNKKLDLNIPIDETVLTGDDLVAVVRYMLLLAAGEGIADDIDHLGNRRVRTIGELLENQFRAGLARMEKAVREKMGILDLENVMPRNLVNSKPITTSINDFFGRSQLSQFLDQINPLAELTHKRRLSALGPGGLNRERAGFEVRDVHHTHYGRICPIETPEGPNIGLISSLSTYARINDFGFIETPYREVEEGRVTEGIAYLTADDEDTTTIAQANAPFDEYGTFTAPEILCRRRGEFPQSGPKEVDYMDISPMQLVSVSAALIPFLENDDANRALMGSNMQRQAVPLLKTSSPIIGTGVEYRAAKDSGVVIVAKRSGTVKYVSAAKIIVTPDEPNVDEPEDVYYLQKFTRSNQNTCINQRPIAETGQRVEAGDVLADGPATDRGELALGKNVLCAFMSWEGHNFEDAIVVSERLMKDDVFTSIHIEEFKTEARDTKLGEEEITRDIPNVGEDALKNLDENGVIRIGAGVRSGDIMVGKISPKGKVQTSNVEKLLRAIFGRRAEDVRDISLKAPSGTEGTVIDVKIFSRKMRTGKTRSEDDQQIKKLNHEKDKTLGILMGQKDSRARALLLGKTTATDVYDLDTGEIIVPVGTAIGEKELERLQNIPVERIRVDDSDDIDRILIDYYKKIEETQQRYEKEIEYIKTGDNLPPGVIKLVKVYVAKKGKLQVGDKMAGRHGNKGVVAKIVPEEDMPFLEDGTPVDIVLNPLGVPSRMNVGQIYETHLGWGANIRNISISTPVFDGATQQDVEDELSKSALTVDVMRYVDEERDVAARIALMIWSILASGAKTIGRRLNPAQTDFDQIPSSAAKVRECLHEALETLKRKEHLDPLGGRFEAIERIGRLWREEERLASLAECFLAGVNACTENRDVAEALARVNAWRADRAALREWMSSWGATHGIYRDEDLKQGDGHMPDILRKRMLKRAVKNGKKSGAVGDYVATIVDDVEKIEDRMVKSIAGSLDTHPLLNERLLYDEAAVEEIIHAIMEKAQVDRRKIGEWTSDKQHAAVMELVFESRVDPEAVKKAKESARNGGLLKSKIGRNGKMPVYDGKTGALFDQQITVGYIYMMKLNHLVDDKIHARSIGPYSLVTQQPLGGKAQFGGQRLGEMEVWALEAYGAAYALQELLTVKSDDIVGRNKIYEAIVKGENAKAPGLPESFYVLVKELQSLGLNIQLLEKE